MEGPAKGEAGSLSVNGPAETVEEVAVEVEKMLGGRARTAGVSMAESERAVNGIGGIDIWVDERTLYIIGAFPLHGALKAGWALIGGGLGNSSKIGLPFGGGVGDCVYSG